jgi:hypothetical protein
MSHFCNDSCYKLANSALKNLNTVSVVVFMPY